MTTPNNFTLKIADTPVVDDSIPSPRVNAKPHKQRGGIQKLTPEERDAEIDRIRRLNDIGKPALAEGTEPDSDYDG